jgi:hypothetical protein
LLLGDRSPIWAGAITAAVAAIAASADIVVLPGVGHEAIDVAPDLVVSQLRTLLAS